MTYRNKWNLGDLIQTYVGIGVIVEILPWYYIVRLDSGNRIQVWPNQMVSPN